LHENCTWIYKREDEDDDTIVSSKLSAAPILVNKVTGEEAIKRFPYEKAVGHDHLLAELIKLDSDATAIAFCN